MYLAVLFAASLVPAGGAAFSDQHQASRHLSVFFEAWQEYELTNQQSYEVMGPEGDWLLSIRSQGSIIRKQDRWRTIRTSLGIGSQGLVFGALQELVNLEGQATLSINRKAEKLVFPSIAEIRNGMLDSYWSSLQWRQVPGEGASIQFHTANQTDSDLQFAWVTPLFTGITNIDAEWNIVELIRTATSFTQQDCVFLGRECVEWTFEHEIGSGCIKVAPALNYAPLYIRITKNQPTHSFGARQISEWGYHSVVSTSRYCELEDDFSRFVFANELVVTKDTGEYNGTRTTFECELAARSVDEKQLEVASEISEGADIAVSGARQIRAVWKDGQVVLDYDHDLVGELQVAEFSNQPETTLRQGKPVGWIVVLLGLLVLLVVTLGYGNRFGNGKAPQ